MVTPFSAEGELDLPLAARLAAHLVNQGSDGLVVCGTTGESPTLSWAEQHALFATVKGALAGRAKLIAGSGSNCTAEAVEPMAPWWWCPTTTSPRRKASKPISGPWQPPPQSCP